MKWTKSIPEVSGYYWIRQDLEDICYIDWVEVDEWGIYTFSGAEQKFDGKEHYLVDEDWWYSERIQPPQGDY